MGRQPRQRPISCHLCRVRKLRCSRQFPCSNCTSRGVTCQHEAVIPSQSAAAPATASSVTASGPSASTDTVAGDITSAEVLSRLERLEALLAAQTQGQQGSPWPQNRNVSSSPAYSDPSLNGPGAQISVQTPAVTSAGPTPTEQPVPMPPRLQMLTADALRLEQSWSGQMLMNSAVADPIMFRTCPIRLITKPSTFVFRNPPSSSLPDPSEPTRCIWLPQREEAHALVQKYVKDITHLHHIIHSPSIRCLPDYIYSALDRNASADLGAIVLFLGICASTTFSWVSHDDAMRLFSSSKEANGQATSWVKATLDVVDYAVRVAHSSIECIQGLIICFCVLWNMEGISSRARTMIFQATTMARELALHRLDYPNNSMVPESIRTSAIKSEMGRRVFWYLASTDWMLAQFSVPQEGTFIVQPKHMAIRRPKNVNDDDLEEDKEAIGRPWSEPTSSSYLLQRIRLAEVCQSVLDRNPLVFLSPENVDYEQVLDMDAKLAHFIRELPEFFSLENTQWRHLPPTDPRRSHAIINQRYTLNLLIYRQLCKLHLPYLARGSVQPNYAYSREVCLKSARSIIQTQSDLRAEHLLSFSPNSRLIMVLRSVFLASIAFVLDACLRSDSDENIADSEKMTEAWKILEESQHHSPTAAKLLELSIQVLQKHRPTHPALQSFQKHATDILPHNDRSLPMTPDSTHRIHPKIPLLPQQCGSESETAYLEQQWQAIEGRMDLEAVDWGGLFWGLDTQFI